ncbi:bifunctional glutamate N-acetyltransferase/amino-acid acetyltransferase ArgJ [Desulfococcus sp.]|uniref:bifunctional glutamate N-acetyltransferase/amino-acid acetyltransferase ArgJ n=1 Tax=Desulfococcus sp. TaxID=2025834 RepID=UPI003593B46E
MEKKRCAGFTFAGIAAGIKKKGGRDLGLIVSEAPASVAGVFTRNRVQAAPVLLDRRRVQSGRCQAVIVNSGNANCCTGDAGMRDAEAMSRHAAAALGISEDLVCVASTGVIGQPMPMDAVVLSMPQLTNALSPEGIDEFAEAIMTTDLVPKVVSVQAEMAGTPYTLMGVAKGSGMIRPDMATMLCFIVTDLAVSPEVLQKSLAEGVDRSFNRITVDGDTSTNDTVLMMAGGRSGAAVRSDPEQAEFQARLDDVLIRLARMVVKDGEGATKLVEIAVVGAASEGDARKVADTVAHSNLVKTALFGEDANWGRIIAAAGRSGVPVAPDAIDIRFDGVMMCRNGMTCGNEAEKAVTAVLKKPEYRIVIDLHMGTASASVFTCDFSIDYVKINADYRS